MDKTREAEESARKNSIRSGKSTIGAFDHPEVIIFDDAEFGEYIDDDGEEYEVEEEEI